MFTIHTLTSYMTNIAACGLWNRPPYVGISRLHYYYPCNTDMRVQILSSILFYCLTLALSLMPDIFLKAWESVISHPLHTTVYIHVKRSRSFASGNIGLHYSTHYQISTGIEAPGLWNSLRLSSDFSLNFNTVYCYKVVF